MPDYIMAKIYDFILFPLVYPVRLAILNLVERHHYKKLLDVCCGTGNQLKFLHSRGFDDLSIGMDISGPMLKVAKKGRISGACLQGDATTMPFHDNHFDMTMISFALHEKQKVCAAEICEEMIRVTKKNGHLILVDFSLGPAVPLFVRQLITCLELAAGKEHFGCFRKYCHAGGLDSLTAAFNLTEIERQSIFFNAFTLRVLEK